MSAFPVRNSEAEFEQLGRDGNVVVVGADALEALVEPQGRRAAETVVVDVQRAGEVERVKDLFRGLGAGCAVLEVQRTDGGLDPVGRTKRIDRLLRDFSVRRRR